MTTKLTTSTFLVIKSSCKCGHILIFSQEHRKNVMKIGSSLIKGRGIHFTVLIKVLVVINNLMKPL